MLNKLLANLPFNPSLIGQVSFYAKRLKKETSVRRLGFFLLLLAMLVQLFAAISPPRHILATPSGNDLIYGGFTEQGHAVLHCLNGGPNGEDFGAILAHYGIQCQDLDYGKADEVWINSHDYNDGLMSMGRHDFPQPNETPITDIPGVNGGNPLYMRSLWGWPGNPWHALHGHASKNNNMDFWILYDCGNLVTVGLPSAPATPAPPPTVSTPVDKPSLGYLDVVNCTKIAGWAFDQDLPSATLEVHIYIDGQGAAITQANVSRPDVGAAFPGAGNSHGYSIATPASIKNSSSHRIDAYAIGIDANGNKNNVNPLIGTKTVTLGTCTTPPPFTPGSATCSGLRAIDLTHRAYSFVANTSGNNYTVKKFTFNFGDNTPNDVITNAVNTTVADHVYSKAGTYTVTVTIDVSVQNTATTTVAQTLTCQTKITIAETPTKKPCDQTTSSEHLTDCLVPHKSAKNISRGGSNANGQQAHAGETIEYTLTLKNTASVTVPQYAIQESISDILDYADVTDYHGGTIDKYQVVSWPAVDMQPGQTVTHKLTVKIKDPIPDTLPATSDPNHFDHRMVNIYGDTVTITLPGDIITVTQTVNGKLVNTGPGTSVIAIMSLTIVVGYFFARSRLLSEEIDIVRNDYAATGGL